VKKWVYFFGAGKAEGNGEWRELLGGKGAGLAEMTKIGLAVPAGFTISTEACDYYYKNGKKDPPELKKEVAQHVAHLEKVTKKKLGDPKAPLLVSVRSGSARSMPGMMETILNLGFSPLAILNSVFHAPPSWRVRRRTNALLTMHIAASYRCTPPW